MAITDLTGTKWKFNSTLNSLPNAPIYRISGVAHSAQYSIDFDGIDTRTTSGGSVTFFSNVSGSTWSEKAPCFSYPFANSKWVYSHDGSASIYVEPIVVEIIGPTPGTLSDDTKEGILISWFESNATQIIDPPSNLYNFLDDIGLLHIFEKLKAYMDGLGVKKVKFNNKELPIDASGAVNVPASATTITRTQYQIQAYSVNGDHSGTMTISKVSGKELVKFSAWDPVEQTMTFEQEMASSGMVGDLASLTTDDKTSLVSALNEVYEKSGEPFRVKNWSAKDLNVVIPYCTEDVENTAIDKMEFAIDAEEGAAYQVVGMVAYEVKGTDGKRINCWPVCQFTGNGQTTLSVRWMCSGTVRKTAASINAWVLLKHR